jgi:PAS domain-containing protein
MSVPLMLLAALINERREKEEALQESEERVTLAASAGKLGLWFWNVPRDEIWVGQGRRALFGWAESERVTLNGSWKPCTPKTASGCGQV